MMAKLYWRVKLNGKWTWRPAKLNRNCRYAVHCVEELLLEEEE